MRTAFLLLVFTATALQGWAQNAENRQISLEMKNEPLGSALKQFSNVSGYKVNFPSEDVAPYRVTVSIYQMSPFAALQKMLEGKPSDAADSKLLSYVYVSSLIVYCFPFTVIDFSVITA